MMRCAICICERAHTQLSERIVYLHFGLVETRLEAFCARIRVNRFAQNLGRFFFVALRLILKVARCAVELIDRRAEAIERFALRLRVDFYCRCFVFEFSSLLKICNQKEWTRFFVHCERHLCNRLCVFERFFCHLLRLLCIEFCAADVTFGVGGRLTRLVDLALNVVELLELPHRLILACVHILIEI